jgi:hypothetical protein
MSLVSASIPNLINGVSQQPPSIRLKTQGQSQTNGLSSVVDGLSKRPPTKFITNLALTNAENAFIHTIRRDDDEFYTVIITNNDIYVLDRDGDFRTVNNATTYLSGLTNPKKELAATTIADYTFLVNKNVVTAKAATTAASRNKEALVYLKNSDYSCKYEVQITKDGLTYTRSIETMGSAQGDNATTRQAETSIQTDRIIGSLNPLAATDATYYGAAAALSIPDFQVDQYGNVLHLYTTDGSDFTIKCTDSRGDTQLAAFKEVTTDFKKLPPTGPDGFVIGVTGDNDKGQDDYYVKLKTNTVGQQVWDETIKPGVEIALDSSTMPHQLISEADGSFTIEEMNFAEREVGDDDTNPFPSFIGFTLEDIFFHRNRLGFLADENVILAESGEFNYFNFFKKTTLTIVDSDAIDVAVSNDKVSLLKYAIPFNESLLLFSDQTQFKLDATDVLTPETVSINVTTQFEADLNAKPVGAGRYVFFAVDRGKYSSVREYYVDVNSDVDDAADITAHVPSYIKGGITKFASSTNEDMLLLITDNDPKAVYVYRYYWQGTEKLQSSWSRWVFTGNVKNISFNKSEIDIILEYPDISGTNPNYCLERIDLTDDAEAVQVTGTHSILLDRREILTTDQDEVTPFLTSVGSTLPQVVYVSDTGKLLTAQQAIDYIADTEGKVFAGFPYLFEYEFSEQLILQNKEPVSTGRLQIRNLSLLYSNSGYFETVVQADNRNASTSTFTGQLVGSSIFNIGQVAIETGVFKFPVLSKSDQVTMKIRSNSHLPCTFQSAEWEGYFVVRSRKL